MNIWFNKESLAFRLLPNKSLTGRRIFYPTESLLAFWSANFQYTIEFPCRAILAVAWKVIVFLREGRSGNGDHPSHREDFPTFFHKINFHNVFHKSKFPPKKEQQINALSTTIHWLEKVATLGMVVGVQQTSCVEGRAGSQ